MDKKTGKIRGTDIMGNQGSTSQLKQVLGFKELFSTAVGQIIGAGVMTLLGSAIGLTGRSVPFAFLVAAILIVGLSIPMILIPGTVNVRGGQGLLVGVEFDDTISGVDVKHGCIDRHLLITAIGAHTIRMIPPLIITEEDCDQAVKIIDETVSALSE